MEENNKEESTMFYKMINGTIPSEVIDDFGEDEANYLLIFVNPNSGSQEGKIILDYIEKYRQISIRNYNIIHFPIDEQNDWFPTSFSFKIKFASKFRRNKNKRSRSSNKI